MRVEVFLKGGKSICVEMDLPATLEGVVSKINGELVLCGSKDAWEARVPHPMQVDKELRARSEISLYDAALRVYTTARIIPYLNSQLLPVEGLSIWSEEEPCTEK